MKIPGRNAVRAAGACAATDPGIHQIVGLRFDRDRAELRAAAVVFPPLVQRASPNIVAVASRAIPTALLRQLRSAETESIRPENLCAVRQEIHELTHSLVQEILAASDSNVLAIGCHGSGIWLTEHDAGGGYCELLDVSRLAETFGKTIVFDFASRHFACHGTKSIESYGLALLLADCDQGPGYRWRGLVEMSETVCRFTMIPPRSDNLRLESVYSHDIAVGLRLLAELRMRDPENGEACPAAYDSAGTPIPELIEIWDRAARSSYPRATDGSHSCLPLLYALDQSPYRTALLQDQLATAISFLAQRVTQYVLDDIAPTRPIGELFLMGEGVRNPELMQAFADRLAFIPQRKLDGLGQDRTMLAASIAALTMLHIWHVPLGPCDGTGIPRVLGGILPGTPNNWHQVLHEMTLSVPGSLRLREAI